MSIPVYTYRLWTHDRGAYVIHERRATRQYIERAGGEIHEKSERLVDEIRLTPEGEEIADRRSH
ncbi:MAG TPA: hypothetical protein VFW28_01205 [Micropepsaceae bacterium]|nr:hypothetical protein [Micropepsaceae bacterium]